MVIHQLFGSAPSRELSDAVASAFGLASIEDSSPFTRADVVSRGTVDALVALRPRLMQVYIPCKAAVYVKQPITPERCLTILRHFLKVSSLHLTASDFNFEGRRSQVYRIHRGGAGVVKMTRASEVV